MPTIDIIVTKLGNDYRASVSDVIEVWECGKTEAEAVGKLVISLRSNFGITIIREKAAKKRKR